MMHTCTQLLHVWNRSCRCCLPTLFYPSPIAGIGCCLCLLVCCSQPINSRPTLLIRHTLCCRLDICLCWDHIVCCWWVQIHLEDVPRAGRFGQNCPHVCSELAQGLFHILQNALKSAGTGHSAKHHSSTCMSWGKFKPCSAAWNRYVERTLTKVG